MARSDAVWGIDIGQCALKALRCRPHEEPTRVVADAFDYIEYPKILSQPDVDPVELVRDAIKQFLSRNSVRGDRVVISVSGQSGLARFIKLPPVETKKIPDIVKYEARQQIPFALDDVVWDYQQMAGGSIVEGFAMETEVGLFAMKRDQVYRALRPYTEAGIEVDIIQLAPLALYNFVAFDQMPGLPTPEEYDPESPPESVVVLSLGTDTTDLVVTNGFRVWQRSIPIGGNHFTKALTKELKLTFASAEHLKRNAAQAEDPKALFQAMRPVFNDLLTEVQRSIGYFTNLDRKAKIGRSLALGNAMKLPGLQRYLAQNLGLDLTRLESFRCLSGSSVIEAATFKDNVPAFGVCYGLALQALRDTKIKTNLLPREIAKDRLVRSKKPWAVGAAAALLLGCSISYIRYWQAANSVRMKDYFEGAVNEAKAVVTKASNYKNAFDKAKTGLQKTADTGEGFIQNVIGRDIWLKVLKAINVCLPSSEGERPKEITEREEIIIDQFNCEYRANLADWYKSAQAMNKDVAEAPAAAAPPANPAAAPANPAAAPANAAAPAATGAGPSGPGLVFEIRAHHFHNVRGNPDQGAEFVRKRIMRLLKQDEVEVPHARQVGGPATYPVKKLGIACPVLIEPNGSEIDFTYKIPLDDAEDEEPDAADGKKAPNNVLGAGFQGPMVAAPRYDFIIQFCWQEQSSEAMIVAVAPVAETPAADASAPEPAAAPGAVTDAAQAERAKPAEPAGSEEMPAEDYGSEGASDEETTPSEPETQTSDEPNDAEGATTDEKPAEDDQP